MPSGASSALLAPDSEQSDRIHQLLNRLARSAASVRPAPDSEVFAAPRFVGDMAALARTAMAAAEDAAAAAAAIAQSQTPRPVREAPIRNPAATSAPPVAVAPAPSVELAGECEPAEEPALDIAPAEMALPDPPSPAPAPQPLALPADTADIGNDLPNTDDLPSDIILHGPFAFCLVDNHGHEIDHPLAHVDPQTGQVRPRALNDAPQQPITLYVRVRDAVGVQLIERLHLAPSFFADAPATNPIQSPKAAASQPVSEARDAAPDRLVIDELGPVETDIAAYLTTGPDGIIQLIRLPEQDAALAAAEIIIVDVPQTGLAYVGQWRERLQSLIVAAPRTAVWCPQPAQRPLSRGISNPFRNAGTAHIAVRLPANDFRTVQLAGNRFRVVRPMRAAL
jgi:hypothetical protein